MLLAQKTPRIIKPASIEIKSTATYSAVDTAICSNMFIDKNRRDFYLKDVLLA